VSAPSRPAQTTQQALPKGAPSAGATQAAAAEPERPARKTDSADARPTNRTPDEPPRAKAADQNDDLLNPTEEELRGTAPSKAGQKAAQPERAVRSERAAPPEPAAQPERAARRADTADAKAGNRT